MAQPAVRAGRIVSRSVLIVVIVVSGLGLLASLLYGAMTQDSLRYSSTCMDVRIAGSLPPLPRPEFQGADAQYSFVELCAAHGTSRAGSLQMAASLIPFLVGGLTCLVLLLLAVQMLRGRSFGLGVAISMFVVATVTIAAGVARPGIQARAEELLVASAGLPTSWGKGHPAWLLPDSPDWTSSDWPLIMIGLLIALGGWLVLRARQLRLDLEGTI